APPISAAPELHPPLSLPRFCRRKRQCESSDPTRKRRSPPRGSPERTPGYRGRNPPPRREVAPALKWSTGRLRPPQLGGRAEAGGHGGTRVEVYASTSSSRGWWGRPGDRSHNRFRPPPAALQRRGARGGPVGPRTGDETCSTTTRA
ncbi:hypothetical protein ZEAMMB73_Zm00001d046582, partial [Zea mays]